MSKDRLNQVELAACMALVEASELLQRRLGEQLKRDGNITSAQFEILAYLAKAPQGLRMSDLAEQTVLSRSGLTYRVTQLERLGLMKRLGNSEDERSTIASATPKGAALIRRVLPRHIALLRESFFSVMSADDLTALGTILARVVAHLRDPKDRGVRDGQKSPRESRRTVRSARRG